MDRDGYGLDRRSRVHLRAWREAGRELPPGKVLDHLCRRRACLEVTHLEPVTQGENELRKSYAYRVRRVRCPEGHAIDPAVMTPEGGRLCRSCVRRVQELDAWEKAESGPKP